MKLTKQRLKEIIKEELSEATEVPISTDLFRRPHDPKPRPDEAEGVYEALQEMIIEIDGLRKVIENISTEHGAFVHVSTYAKMARDAIAKLSDKVEGAMLERDRWEE